MPSWRSVAVPAWDDIRENYPAQTRAELEPLMQGFQAAHGGQLILWHGLAGTGKTFCLRALAWEWRDWCDLHYIVDPDSFFGEHADYLMSVLMQPEYTPMLRASQHGFIASSGMSFGHVVESVEADDDEDRASKAWRVLVLEDTGELLSADARVSMGQGLSRFLNVVDGLIGQGLRVLVLVTTNEPIRRLHPAVARPGRCAANVEFTPLSRPEAAAWLASHGGDSAVDAPATIAQLYARLHGLESGELPPLVGFAE
jgi:SpoVK/Ycf46/Vps4 family AAA+-type ATPase